MEDEPPGYTNEHDAAWLINIREYTGEPAGQSCCSSIYGEEQCGVACRKAKVDHVLREERLLNAIAGHAEDDGDIAAKQRQWHAKKVSIRLAASVSGVR